MSQSQRRPGLQQVGRQPLATTCLPACCPSGHPTHQQHARQAFSVREPQHFEEGGGGAQARRTQQEGSLDAQLEQQAHSRQACRQGAWRWACHGAAAGRCHRSRAGEPGPGSATVAWKQPGWQQCTHLTRPPTASWPSAAPPWQPWRPMPGRRAGAGGLRGDVWRARGSDGSRERRGIGGETWHDRGLQRAPGHAGTAFALQNCPAAPAREKLVYATSSRVSAASRPVPPPPDGGAGGWWGRPLRGGWLLHHRLQHSAAQRHLKH